MKSLRILSIIISIVIIFIFNNNFVLARAWWGWSWGWSWGWAIWIVVIWIYYAIMQIRRKKMLSKAKSDLETASVSDNSWNENELKKTVEDNFYRYQQAWTSKNLDSIKKYMTKSYYAQAITNIDKLAWKTNILKDIKINELNLMSVKDGPWKDWDMFVMEINASMIDYTINDSDWSFIESTMKLDENESQENYINRAMNNPSSFIEYWVFMRLNWYWLIHNIKQTDVIIKDIIWLSENELKNILIKEQNSWEINDSNFYN